MSWNGHAQPREIFVCEADLDVTSGCSATKKSIVGNFLLEFCVGEWHGYKGHALVGGKFKKRWREERGRGGGGRTVWVGVAILSRRFC